MVTTYHAARWQLMRNAQDVKEGEVSLLCCGVLNLAGLLTMQLVLSSQDDRVRCLTLTCCDKQEIRTEVVREVKIDARKGEHQTFSSVVPDVVVKFMNNNKEAVQIHYNGKMFRHLGRGAETSIETWHGHRWSAVALGEQNVEVYGDAENPLQEWVVDKGKGRAQTFEIKEELRRL